MASEWLAAVPPASPKPCWHDDVIKWKLFPRCWPYCGEFAGHRWIHLTKDSDAELWYFLWSARWINGWLNNRETGDLRRHRAHYDVIVMENGYSLPPISWQTCVNIASCWSLLYQVTLMIGCLQQLVYCFKYHSRGTNPLATKLTHRAGKYLHFENFWLQNGTVLLE